MELKLKKSKTNKNNILRFSLYGNPNATFDKVHGNYYPMAYDNYITICTDNSYPFWNEVLEIILPTLHLNKIGIVSLSIKDNANQKNCQTINNINIRHAAYLFDNCLGHFCGQDWSLTLAQNNGIKNYSFVATGNPESLFQEEFGGYVDELDKPELVAREIFKRLNIEQEISVDSQFIGPSYGPSVLELIPDFDIQGYPNVSDKTTIGIRCDLVENWNFVLSAVRHGVKPIVTCKNLPRKPISGFLVGVQCINLYVDENTDPKAIKEIESTGVSYKLLTEDENCEKVRRNLFDFPNIHFVENWGDKNLDKLESLNYDTRIRSKRLLVGARGTFLSVYHWKNNLPINNPKGCLVLDGVEDQDFLKEADLFYYYN